jgi:hypothetical protein
MFVFLNYSEGTMQRAIALLTCAFDLVGVGLMVVAEILLGGQTWAVAPESLGEYAVWGIGVWTVANVVSVVLFHIGSPDARRQMAMQSQKDAVLEAALQNLDSRRIADGGRLANTIADSMYHELVAELFSDGDGQPSPASLPLGSPGDNEAQKGLRTQTQAAAGTTLSANGRGDEGADARPFHPDGR